MKTLSLVFVNHSIDIVCTCLRYTSVCFFMFSCVDAVVSNEGRRLTRLEKARIETLQSFGGSGLDDILSSSKQKAMDEENEAELSVAKEEKENKENTPVISDPS